MSTLLLDGVVARKSTATAADAEGWSAGLLSAERSAIVGSVFMFGEGNDVDILVLTEDMSSYVDAATDKGYKLNTSYGSNWCALRKGLVNLLVTEDEDHYDQTLAGSLVCRALASKGMLSPSDRDTRVLIHQVLRGEVLV